MKRCEYTIHFIVNRGALGVAHFGYRGVPENSTLKMLHHVEHRTDNLIVIAERNRLLAEFAADIHQIEQQEGPGSVSLLTDSAVENFRYPVLQYPTKISSHNFDKNPLVSGRLQGIKGQYLILDTGVINLRKFTSYHIHFSVD